MSIDQALAGLLAAINGATAAIQAATAAPQAQQQMQQVAPQQTWTPPQQPTQPQGAPGMPGLPNFGAPPNQAPPQQQAPQAPFNTQQGLYDYCQAVYTSNNNLGPKLEAILKSLTPTGEASQVQPHQYGQFFALVEQARAGA